MSTQLSKKSVARNYAFLAVMLGAMILGSIVGWIFPQELDAEGNVISAEDGKTRLIHVSTENTLKEGALIITAGSSGLFPKDYAIGTVESIGLDAGGLSACAEIKPCVDITRLSSVTVITDFSGKKEDSDED